MTSADPSRTLIFATRPSALARRQIDDVVELLRRASRRPNRWRSAVIAGVLWCAFHQRCIKSWPLKRRRASV